MRLTQITIAGIAAALLLTTAALAQTDSSDKESRELSKTNEPLNRVAISYRAGFNLNIRFKNIGAFQPFNPGGTGHNQVHNYDDGYVREDNNNHPFNDSMTWNYAYQSSSQVQDNQLLSLHSSSTTGATGSGNSDLRNGFEITYSRELGQLNKCKWGVELAFNYTGGSGDDSRSYTSSAGRVTDVYMIPEGVVPSVPGFDPNAPPPAFGPGSSNGPGPLIFDSPVTRTNEANVGTSSTVGSRHLDADIFGLKLGPYLKVPVCKHAWLTFSGGLAFADVNSDFRYSELITMTTPTYSSTTANNASGSKSGLMVGGYVTANISAKLSERFDAFAGMQFQSMGTYRHTIKGETAEIDLSKAVFFVVGLGYSF